MIETAPGPALLPVACKSPFVLLMILLTIRIAFAVTSTRAGVPAANVDVILLLIALIESEVPAKHNLDTARAIVRLDH